MYTQDASGLLIARRRTDSAHNLAYNVHSVWGVDSSSVVPDAASGPLSKILKGQCPSLILKKDQVRHRHFRISAWHFKHSWPLTCWTMFGRLFEPAGSVTWPLKPSAGVSCPSLASDGPEPCPPRRLSRRAPSRTPSQSARPHAPHAPHAPHRGAHSGGMETQAAARAEATRRCSRQCAGGTTIPRTQESASVFVRAKILLLYDMVPP